MVADVGDTAHPMCIDLRWIEPPIQLFGNIGALLACWVIVRLFRYLSDDLDFFNELRDFENTELNTLAARSYRFIEPLDFSLRLPGYL
jgi:hypothetical protein